MEKCILRFAEPDYGATHFISGMALGTDIWAAEIVLKLRNTTHPHLTLECVLPFRGQTELWSGVAAYLLAVYSSRIGGGTGKTVRYAAGRVELSVVIDPLTFEIRRQPT